VVGPKNGEGGVCVTRGSKAWGVRKTRVVHNGGVQSVVVRRHNAVRAARQRVWWCVCGSVRCA